jgi:hypothetical protein
LTRGRRRHPDLPAASAFISPKVFEAPQEKFDVKLITSEPPRELFEFATVRSAFRNESEVRQEGSWKRSREGVFDATEEI